MPEEPPTSERAAVYYIAAIIKNYEPEFELRKNFTPGSGSMVWFETDI
jgi:ribosomal protein S24E